MYDFACLLLLAACSSGVSLVLYVYVKMMCCHVLWASKAELHARLHK